MCLHEILATGAMMDMTDPADVQKYKDQRKKAENIDLQNRRFARELKTLRRAIRERAVARGGGGGGRGDPPPRTQVPWEIMTTYAGRSRLSVPRP